jgi:hypothetical protein
MTKAETCPILSTISIVVVSVLFFAGAPGRLVGGKKTTNKFGSRSNKVTSPPSGIETPQDSFNMNPDVPQVQVCVLTNLLLELK